MKNIALIGFMGAGKSTVAEAPAEKIWHGDCGNGCPDYKKRKSRFQKSLPRKGKPISGRRRRLFWRNSRKKKMW